MKRQPLSHLLLTSLFPGQVLRLLLLVFAVVGLVSWWPHSSSAQNPPEDIAGSYTGTTAATASNCQDPFDNGQLPPLSVNVRLFQPTVNGAVRTVTGLLTVAQAGPNGEDLILDLSATLSPPGNGRTLTNGALAVRPPSAFTGGGIFSGQWTRGTPDALTLNYTVSGTAFSSNCTVTGTVNDTRLGPPPPITFTQGILTQPPGALDPQVQATQQNGVFTIKPRAGTPDLHYNGFTSDQDINLNDYNVGVEVKQTATGGAESVFSIGEDSTTFFRFVKIDGTRTPGASASIETDSLRSISGAGADASFLFFQIKVNGVLSSFNIPYDAVLHRFWRFRHQKQDNTINFETSPNQATWTIRHTVILEKGVSELTAELSAGTSTTVTDPGSTVFGNFLLGDNFAISGQVKNAGNVGFGGVLMSLTGWSTATATTDSNGKYSFPVLDAGKNYSVTPSLSGYTFPSGSQTFNALGSDKVADFSAAACAFALTSTSASPSATGGTGSVSFTATGADCVRSAISNAPWITITSGATGAGSGTVNYSVATNTSSIARSGTITIGGQTFTVNQAAPAWESVMLTAGQTEINTWTDRKSVV